MKFRRGQRLEFRPGIHDLQPGHYRSASVLVRQHGEAKAQHGLRRPARHGLWNVAVQVYLTAAVSNLKRLARALLRLFLRPGALPRRLEALLDRLTRTCGRSSPGRPCQPQRSADRRKRLLLQQAHCPRNSSLRWSGAVPVLPSGPDAGRFWRAPGRDLSYRRAHDWARLLPLSRRAQTSVCLAVLASLRARSRACQRADECLHRLAGINRSRSNRGPTARRRRSGEQRPTRPSRDRRRSMP